MHRDGADKEIADHLASDGGNQEAVRELNHCLLLSSLSLIEPKICQFYLSRGRRRRRGQGRGAGTKCRVTKGFINVTSWNPVRRTVRCCKEGQRVASMVEEVADSLHEWRHPESQAVGHPGSQLPGTRAAHKHAVESIDNRSGSATFVIPHPALAYSWNTKPTTRTSTRTSSTFSGVCFFIRIRSMNNGGRSIPPGRPAPLSSSALKGRLCRTLITLLTDPVNSKRMGISLRIPAVPPTTAGEDWTSRWC